MTGHLTTTGIRQVIGQRGSILAAIATVALIGSALVVMVLSYREAVAAHDFVARARERDTLVQRGEVLLARPGGDERVPAHAKPRDSARDRGARPFVQEDDLGAPDEKLRPGLPSSASACGECPPRVRGDVRTLQRSCRARNRGG